MSPPEFGINPQISRARLPSRLPGRVKSRNDSSLVDGNTSADASLNVGDISADVSRHFSYLPNLSISGRRESISGVDRSYTGAPHSGRYQFPGSEMTMELYERRGVDLNNNA